MSDKDRQLVGQEFTLHTKKKDFTTFFVWFSPTLCHIVGNLSHKAYNLQGNLIIYTDLILYIDMTSKDKDYIEKKIDPCVFRDIISQRKLYNKRYTYLDCEGNFDYS